MARVEGGAVILDTDWPGIKLQIDTRNINFKYEEDDTAYQIFAIDGQYFYQTVIYKSGQAPQNQATYDTWRAEFEADYKNRITDFNATQPFYLSNIDGYSVVLKDGAVPGPNDGYGIALIGFDGSNYRMLRADASGRLALNGLGTAGSPSGGIVSIQGVVGGTDIPVSVSNTVTVTGTVTATNPSVGSNDTTAPTSSTLIGGTDGTSLRASRIFDLDTGGGQQWVLGVGLRKAAGGGSVELGTSSDPIRIDPTGTTTQPVSATQNGTWTVQPGNTANTTPWLITINQGGNSATVTASNALKVDGSAVTQPVSGTVTANAGTGDFTVVQSTASNLRTQTASESATGSAIPTIASLTAGSDGTNLRSLFVDTSGRLIVIGGAASGAAVAGNPILIAGSDGTNARSIRTATDGTVRVDPTGTTTQPVSGTVAATQSGTWNINNISGTITLPTGAATETTLTGVLTTAAFQARINTLGQKTMANSTPIVIASDQTVIPVSDNGASLTIDNSTLSVVGGGTEATALRVTIANNSTGVLSVDDNGASLTVDTTQLPAALVGGRLDANVGAWLGSIAPTVGQKAMASSVPVVVSSDQSTLPVKEIRSASSSVTSVAASASNVTLLASNANRLAATIYNDSNSALYLKLGATASTTSFTVKMNRDDYYEVPGNYTGAIHGIWSVATGSARITELS